ncbi:hypothetical protein [Zhihengliuella sp.]|uniref:hypothetical protein n=1 Tax=Zhihengliuella sp. TaxID=1954483 RepID=UPI002811EA9D|nr:hypothetical protein [Zhihengliuella sp.]
MTEQIPEQLDPVSFSIDDWLTDAALPEESVDVYKRADVISELTEIERRVEDLDKAEDVDAGEESIGEASPRQKLLRRYEQLLQEFADSRLTIYVRAIPKEKLDSLNELYQAECGASIAGSPQRVLAQANHGARVLCHAIAGVKAADGKRYDVHWTPDQLRKIARMIGEVQLQQIAEAHRLAQNAVPEVNADFLRNASGTSKEPDEA